ncbi:lamin tail domain-containing protein [Candidatus Dojkabacteria bacterium]|nr:lamin tail domain-containing protein [Candidatus Dojkabacteria bacterium]
MTPKLLLFILTLALLSIAVSQFPYQKSYANSESILINEVFYDPIGSDSGKEWLELKNISNNTIDLNGWSIEKAGSSFSEIAILPSYQIEPGEIALIGEPYVEYADIAVASLSFQNGGAETDGIRILDQDGIVVDTLLYDEPNTNNLPSDLGEPVPGFAKDVNSGSSLSRINSIDSDICSDDFIETESPTPGEENLIPPTVQFEPPEEVYIGKEIVISGSESYDPDGSIKKWNWTILDPTEVQSYYSEPEILFSPTIDGEYIITLTITDNDDLSSSIEKSIAAVEDPENPITTAISDVKTLEVGIKISVMGTVTVPTGVVSDTDFYIQDQTGGIRIRSQTQDAKLGETYYVKGTLKTYYGEKYILSETITNTESTYKITPKIVPPDKITENYIGLLITTEAEIEKIDKEYISIKVGDQILKTKIYISNKSDIEIPEDQDKKYITVTGIVSRYGTNSDGSPRLRLIPRFQNDIAFSNNPTLLARTGTGIYRIYLYAIFFYTIYLISYPTFLKVCTTSQRSK